jgi:hypothetical protein
VAARGGIGSMRIVLPMSPTTAISAKFRQMIFGDSTQEWRQSLTF